MTDRQTFLGTIAEHTRGLLPLGFGKLHHRTGKLWQAQGHLPTATTMSREMDMQSWPEQAEAEMAPARPKV